MEHEETPNYFAIIPANVRYDKDLPANAKLLYAELTSLVNKYGYAFAKNEYFANLYGLSEDRISRLLHILEKKGYIKIVLERNENNFVINRKIYLEQARPEIVEEECDDSPSVKITMEDGKNTVLPSVKIPSSNGKNNETNNNTYNNKTINNISADESSDKPTKKDYDECRSIIKSNKEYLLSKGKDIETTDYSSKVLNKFLKTIFSQEGVERTKLGLINSVNNNWLVDTAKYSMTGLFSSKMFAKYIANEAGGFSKKQRACDAGGGLTAVNYNSEF